MLSVSVTGPRFVVQIGDKMIDYNEEFRMFLTTRNPNPEIPPDAASVVTEVNFTTTRAGLTGQVNLDKSAMLSTYDTLLHIFLLYIELHHCKNSLYIILCSYWVQLYNMKNQSLKWRSQNSSSKKKI